MKQTFVDAFRSNERLLTINNIDYQFLIEDYRNTDGYARCLIWDKTNNERYHSEGYLEVNGITIVTKWKEEYSYDRDNWVHSNELIVETF